MLKVIEWPIYILLIDCEGFDEGFFFPVLPCMRQRVESSKEQQMKHLQSNNKWIK